nr:MAG TPA: hypothetical protein [Caudoviricetes sp.]
MGASCKSPFELYTRIFVIYPPAAVLPSLSGIVIFMDFSEYVLTANSLPVLTT